MPPWAFFDQARHDQAVTDFVETWDVAKGLDGYDAARWEEAFDCLTGISRDDEEVSDAVG